MGQQVYVLTHISKHGSNVMGAYHVCHEAFKQARYMTGAMLFTYVPHEVGRWESETFGEEEFYRVDMVPLR